MRDEDKTNMSLVMIDFYKDLCCRKDRVAKQRRYCEISGLRRIMIGWNAEEKANKNILKSAYKSQTKRLGFVHTSLNVQPETEPSNRGREQWKIRLGDASSWPCAASSPTTNCPAQLSDGCKIHCVKISTRVPSSPPNNQLFWNKPEKSIFPPQLRASHQAHSIPLPPHTSAKLVRAQSHQEQCPVRLC